MGKEKLSMNNHYTLVENQVFPIIGETAVIDLSHIWLTWPSTEMPSNISEDEMRPFMLMGERDIFKELGPISKEDYDYYENL